MISAFAKAGQIFEEQAYTDRAIKAANFLRKESYNAEEKSILRSNYSDHGQLSQMYVPTLVHFQKIEKVYQLRLGTKK